MAQIIYKNLVGRYLIIIIIYLLNKFATYCTIDKLALKSDLHMQSSKRKFIDTSFIFKILNYQGNCPDIFEEIGWLVQVPTFNLKYKMLWNYNSKHFDSNFDDVFKLRLLYLN